MSGENECAHSSYDLILDMLEKNVVVQLPPSKFPSRRSELSNEKVVKEVTLDSSSRLQLKDQKTEVMCDTGSELLLTQALQRRALALDLTNAATYATVQEYNDYLIRQLQATVPGGYKRVDVQQVLRADQEAFNRMSELLTEGLRRKPDGSLPMDEAFRRLLTDAKVAFTLLPLPARPVGTGDDHGSGLKRKRTEDWQQQHSGKSKGKSKHKSKSKGGRVPQELIGKITVTKQGKPVCFNFNLPGGCPSGLKAGQSCARGLHVCAEPGCGLGHSMQDHGKSSS